MTISRRQAIGAGLFAAAAAATGAGLFLRDHPDVAPWLSPREKISLWGFVGGEKMQLLANPKFIKLLRDKFGLTLDGHQAGSVEMVRAPDLLAQKPQWLWPSSDVMIELARMSSIPVKRAQVIVNSPIVIYSWLPVAEGLRSAGIVEQVGGTYYVVDTKRLLAAHTDAVPWRDIGITALEGKARIQSTDPNKSNSGFMFAGLAANLLSDDVADQASLTTNLPVLQKIFARMGFMSHSSGKLFDDYLTEGMGAYPLVVGYENQLIEWALADPARWARVHANKDISPVVLYPKPTVFSSHPLLALDDKAMAMVPALLSPEVQKLAWSEHGFRGPVGSADAGEHTAVGLVTPQVLTSVLPMPDATTMLSLIQALGKVG